MSVLLPLLPIFQYVSYNLHYAFYNRLEQETGYFFDLKFFEELVLNGNWEEAEKYLSSFTVVEDNKYSTKIYFEIRKQKFLEALDK